jgi:hypothetical protein
MNAPVTRKRPAGKRRNARASFHVSDTVGQLAHEVGIIETLANAAAHVIGRRGDDGVVRRRLGDLVVQIACAASEAFATASGLDEALNAGGES